MASKRSLPGEVSVPPDFKKGQILKAKAGDLFLRVVSCSGKTIHCQTRQGVRGRFSGESKAFSRAKLLSLYEVVK